MASIRRKGNGFEAQVRTKGFKSKSKTFKKMSDARRWATDIEAQQAKGVFTDTSEASNTSFSDCLARYEKDQESLGRRSMASLKSQLNVLRKSELAYLSLANITPKVITKFRDDRIAGGLKAATVIKDLTMLSALFKHIQREWHIELPKGNPVDLVSNPKHKDPTSRERRFEKGEEKKLLDYLDAHSPITGLVLRLALATGMRRGEILNIALGHIEPNKGTITIPKTKTDYPRVIPLPHDAWSVVSQIINSPSFPVNFYDANEVYLFTIRPDSVTRAFGRACKALGIKNLTFHDARHEAISRLFEKGLDMMEVSLVSGHRSFDMLKKYTHLRPESLLDRMNG